MPLPTDRPSLSLLPAPRFPLMAALAAGAVLASSSLAHAQPPASPKPVERPSAPAGAASQPVQNSAMDAPLFYQVLIAEIEANGGNAGPAYQLYLESARRQQPAHQGSQLYQRAVEIALRARAGEQALAAAKAWRQGYPQSREASDYTAQILIALGRTNELAAPLRTLIQLTPAPQQPQVIAGLPRSLQRLPDKQAVARLVDDATQPWRQPPLELAEAWAASGEAWLGARQPDKVMAAAQRALVLKPALPLAGLLAIDLMPEQAGAEELVKTQLARQDAAPLVRLAYGRKLASLKRYEDAANQLDALLATQPSQTGIWLTLAAVRMELGQQDKAEAALQRVLDAPPAAPDAPTAEGALPRIASDASNSGLSELQQAQILMAQIAEQRKQPLVALDWLGRADPEHQLMGIQNHRARLLARLGRIDEARATLRKLPETEPRDAAVKIQAEAQMLRDARRLKEAGEVLAEGVRRFPEDVDLIYDQAMVADRLGRHDEMERLLRKALTIAPDNANALNALGYSLADRGQRLDEARSLIERALQQRPGDPYITDSLGWVMFRAGQTEDALRTLQEAYAKRADPEIGAHIGEVLWQMGRREEAMRYFRESRQGDPDNETLRDTLKRLKIKL